MLPDDLENLAQSIIATNFFGNNILQVLTTKNYWDLANEYKPLMHTWSLAIEEQYYLFYPFIFLLLGKHKIKWILPILIITCLCSLVLYLSPFSDYNKFYLLQFRFFELAIGGIAAIFMKERLYTSKFSSIFILALVVLLVFDLTIISDQIKLILSVVLTLIILIFDQEANPASKFLIQNKMAVFIGKISFSLYMWHQVVLAFGRYFLFDELDFPKIVLLLVLIFIFSYLTYLFIEQPFRNKKKIKTKWVLAILISVIFISSLFSYYIYQRAGVLKDIPELGIQKENVTPNMHAQFNDRIYVYDKPFNLEKGIKVLVIGNSFARDWANVLLASEYAENLSISYIYNPIKHPELSKRKDQADIIFISSLDYKTIEELKLKTENSWLIGPKSFGVNNGIFYNHSGEDYCFQRTLVKESTLETNFRLKEKWSDRYIDLLSYLIDDEHKVPVFTPDCKFMSQDCRHFTTFGAEHMAGLLDDRLGSIFRIK